MGKLGNGLHTDENNTRIFVSPDVTRYPDEKGGEVIVVGHTDRPARPSTSEDE